MYNAIAGTSNKPDFQYQAPPGNIYVFLELLNIGSNYVFYAMYRLFTATKIGV